MNWKKYLSHIDTEIQNSYPEEEDFSVINTQDKYNFICNTIIKAIEMSKLKPKLKNENESFPKLTSQTQSTVETPQNDSTQQTHIVNDARTQIIKSKFNKVFKVKIVEPPWWNSEAVEIVKERRRLEKIFSKIQTLRQLKS